jgi:hypothetical protein
MIRLRNSITDYSQITFDIRFPKNCIGHIKNLLTLLRLEPTPYNPTVVCDVTSLVDYSAIDSFITAFPTLKIDDTGRYYEHAYLHCKITTPAAKNDAEAPLLNQAALAKVPAEIQGIILSYAGIDEQTLKSPQFYLEPRFFKQALASLGTAFASKEMRSILDKYARPDKPLTLSEQSALLLSYEAPLAMDYLQRDRRFDPPKLYRNISKGSPRKIKP